MTCEPNATAATPMNARNPHSRPRTVPATRSASSPDPPSAGRSRTIVGTSTACNAPAANSSKRMFGTVFAEM